MHRRSSYLISLDPHSTCECIILSSYNIMNMQILYIMLCNSYYLRLKITLNGISELIDIKNILWAMPSVQSISNLMLMSADLWVNSNGYRALYVFDILLTCLMTHNCVLKICKTLLLCTQVEIANTLRSLQHITSLLVKFSHSLFYQE